jgi:ABC-type cobalamin transport system ATPase subunit
MFDKLRARWSAFVAAHIVAPDPCPEYSRLDRMAGLGARSGRMTVDFPPLQQTPRSAETAERDRLRQEWKLETFRLRYADGGDVSGSAPSFDEWLAARAERVAA